MADNSRPVAEPLQKSAQAAQAVRGAVKTGKAIAGAAKVHLPEACGVPLPALLGKIGSLSGRSSLRRPPC